MKYTFILFLMFTACAGVAPDDTAPKSFKVLSETSMADNNNEPCYTVIDVLTKQGQKHRITHVTFPFDRVNVACSTNRDMMSYYTISKQGNLWFRFESSTFDKKIFDKVAYFEILSISHTKPN